MVCRPKLIHSRIALRGKWREHSMNSLRSGPGIAAYPSKASTLEFNGSFRAFIHMQ